MKSGIIRLIGSEGGVLSTMSYRDVTHRRKIIADWKFRRGEAFKKSTLSITSIPLIEMKIIELDIIEVNI